MSNLSRVTQLVILELGYSRSLALWMLFVGLLRLLRALPLPADDAHLEALILSGQSVFDVLDGEEMRRARTRANPYEMIRGVFFLNRFADFSLPSPDMTLRLFFELQLSVCLQ